MKQANKAKESNTAPTSSRFSLDEQVRKTSQSHGQDAGAYFSVLDNLEASSIPTLANEDLPVPATRGKCSETIVPKNNESKRILIQQASASHSHFQEAVQPKPMMSTKKSNCQESRRNTSIEKSPKAQLKAKPANDSLKPQQCMQWKTCSPKSNFQESSGNKSAEESPKARARPYSLKPKVDKKCSVCEKILEMVQCRTCSLYKVCEQCMHAV